MQENTHTGRALHDVLNEFKKPSNANKNAKVIIVLTDGA